MSNNLFSIFGLMAQSWIDNDGNCQKSNGNNKVENHETAVNGFRIYCHYDTSLTKYKLADQLMNVKITPKNNIFTLTLSSPKKKGTIIEAEMISPITISMSDNLFICESVNNSNIF
jgi:uncharacterized protein YjbK